MDSKCEFNEFTKLESPESLLIVFLVEMVPPVKNVQCMDLQYFFYIKGKPIKHFISVFILLWSVTMCIISLVLVTVN